jgi:outer membrane protein
MRTMRRRLVIAACSILCCACLAPVGSRAAEGGSITLKSAIETALSANIDLRQAMSLVESRAISVRSSKTQFLPDLRLSMGASRSYGKQQDPYSDRFEWSHSSSTNLSVSSGLQLFSGFGRIASLRQSQLELEAQRRSLTRSREQIIFETIQQFVLVVLDGDLIKADTEDLESQRRQLAQIEAFTASGRRPIVDLYQQQALVSGAESRLLVDQRDYEVDKYNLLQIMAVSPGAEYDIVVPDIDTITTEISSLIPESAVDEALANRADLAAQRLQVEAAKKQITASRSGYWPSLSLSAGAGTSYRSSGSYDFNDQFYSNNLNASIGLSLSAPIFDRLATNSSVSQAKIQLRQAQLGLDKLELQVKIDVQQALQDYATAGKAVEVAEAQIKYSEQALKNMEERYKVNASTLVELTQARASYLQSVYNLINARYSHLVRGIAVLFYSGQIDAIMPFLD